MPIDTPDRQPPGRKPSQLRLPNRLPGRLGLNSTKPQPHFLTICWDVTAEDGTPVTFQATLCKMHRQVIALRSASARGVRRQFGESCDLCSGREPRPLGGS